MAETYLGRSYTKYQGQLDKKSQGQYLSFLDGLTFLTIFEFL
jgi:hypothetical protein